MEKAWGELKGKKSGGIHAPNVSDLAAMGAVKRLPEWLLLNVGALNDG